MSRVWNEWEHGVSLPAEIECSGSRDSVSAGFFFFLKKGGNFSSTLKFYLMRLGFCFQFWEPRSCTPCLMYLYAFGGGWARVEAAYRLRNV